MTYGQVNGLVDRRNRSLLRFASHVSETIFLREIMITDTDEATRKLIGERIAKAREAAGLNPSELSREIGVSRAAVAQWEVGKTEPNARNLRKIASVVGVTLEWLGQGRGTAAAAVGSGSIMSEGELVDLKALPADRAKTLRQLMDGKKAEIWKLT